MKCIVKNVQKYNSGIKLNFGRDLTDAKVSLRPAYTTGVSTKEYGRVWFWVGNKKTIFKTYDTFGYSDTRKIRMANELLCYELAKKMDVKCAVYETALNDKHKGIISYDVQKEYENLVSVENLYYRLCKGTFEGNLKDIAKAVNELEKRGKRVNKKQIFIDLYKIMIFDALTMQNDRHLGNLFFIENSRHNSFRVSPLIDNEFAFNGIGIIDYIKENVDAVSQKEFLEKFENNKDIITMFETNRITDNHSYLKNIKDICELALTNEELKGILIKTIKKMNIKKAIEKVEESGIKLGKDYKEYLVNVESLTKDLFVTELNKQKVLSKESKQKYSDLINYSV